MKVVFVMWIYKSRQVHQLFSEKKARDSWQLENNKWSAL